MKLIRDRIPEIAEINGGVMDYHLANPAEFRHHLQKKLLEEANEFLESGEPEELADILEVIRAIAEERGMTMRDVYVLRDKKRKERGGFDNRVIWENRSKTE